MVEVGWFIPPISPLLFVIKYIFKSKKSGERENDEHASKHGIPVSYATIEE